MAEEKNTEEQEHRTGERRVVVRRRVVKKHHPVQTAGIAILAIVAIVACIVALRFYVSNTALLRRTETLQNDLSRYDGGYTAEEHDKAITQAKESSRQEVLDYIRDEMSSGAHGPLDTVRTLFPDDIILFYEGKYLFHPIDESIPKNTLDPADFKKGTDGFVDYTGSDLNIRTFQGIDVSSYQGYIDWARVAASGVKFAMIRVGFRGWGVTGSLNVDETFTQNIVGAYENGIDVGVYWFPASLDEQEAREEAAFVLETIEPYRNMITYPVALDLELPETNQSRVYGQSMEDVTNNALVFLKEIEEAGYDTMVYGNLTTFVVMTELAKLQDYPTWIAWYDVPLYYPYEYQIWQYTAEGQVDGINTEVDLNLKIETK